MAPAKPWRPLDAFRDRSVPKLWNLRRARRAGLSVPETVWAEAEALRARPPAPAPEGLGFPLIVRSGSPAEDGDGASNAGRFLSLPVARPGDFDDAVARVVAALPARGGRRPGVVFVQPLVEAEGGGVTFFDGFYFEEARAPGGNAALTSGRARGEVTRGHLRRGDPHHAWLARVHRLFGGRLDLEWARPPGAATPTLLQARPACFPIRRNPTISQANLREVLGDAPSPWIVGAFAEAGPMALRQAWRADPAVEAWGEPFAIECAGRAWINLGVFFRMTDRWGLPRRMVTDAIGGPAERPEDARFLPGRLLRRLPTLARVALADYATAFRTGRELRALDAHLARARSLPDLQRATVRGVDLIIRTNIALVEICSVASRIRKWLKIERAGRVVTQDLMERYAALAARPGAAERLEGLDAWLAEHGHRGPQETDPRQPRFAELREALRDDLARRAAPATPATPPAARPTRVGAALGRPLFLADAWREAFRDRMMRRWQVLRRRILEEARRAVEAGRLDEVDDAFFLRAADLAADPAEWRARAAANRARWERTRALDPPNTAGLDEVEALAARDPDAAPGAPPARFAGIGLAREAPAVVGTAVRAARLAEVLDRDGLPESPILVAPTLEPSWAVVFPRFAAVVAELGGELSHAAILLREAGIPAVVNAAGVFAALADGDRLRVDPGAGEVRLESPLSSGSDGPMLPFNLAC
jgi:phosphohistidine swiveling domain-containing protein